MSKKTQKLYTSRVNSLDANTYVGERGRLFYDEPTTTNTAPKLRYSDGVTVGGVPLFAAGDRWPADGTGFLYDDGAGNLSWSSTPTNYSDANVATYLLGNITTGNVINTGDYYYANGASLTSTIQNFVANVDFGNLYIVDETIYGKNTNQDIVLQPAGDGNVTVGGSLKLDNAALITTGTGPVSIISGTLTLSSIVEYSTGTGMPAGHWNNNPSSIAEPWQIIQFTTDPTNIVCVGDKLSAPGMPLSTVVWTGQSPHANTVIATGTYTLNIGSGIITPDPGTTVIDTRIVTNAGLAISTLGNVDVTLSPGNGGQVVVTSNVVPYTNNTLSLGTPTTRWQDIYVGPATIYIQDSSTGNDLSIGAVNGNLFVQGGVGLTVGKFTLFGNTIALNNPAEDFYIGTQYATGNLNINRPLQVINSSGVSGFQVDRSGLTTIHSPASLGPTQALFSVIGSTSGNVQPRNFANTMIQVTGNDNQPNRISFDAFGVTGSQNAYVAIAGRTARGLVDTPQITQAGDTIMRFTGQGWTGNSNYAGSIIRLNMEAAETFTSNLSTGTRLTIQTTPIGSNTIQTTAAFYSNGLNLYGNTVTTGVKFADNTFQNTAFVPGNWVSNITVSTGFAQMGNNLTGHIDLSTTDVHSLVSNSYSLAVTDPSASQNLHLTLAQEIGTNSSVTFGNVSVAGNLYVAGNIISQGATSINGKILYLANNSVTSTDIDGGGIQLGANSAAYARTLKYSLTGLHGDYWYTDTDTGFQTEHLRATDVYMSGNLFSNGSGYFGDAYSGYNFANAGIQVFENVNSYAQIVEQNLSTGTKSTTDFVATANNGTDTTYYVDLGIAGSFYDPTSPNNSLGTSLYSNDSYLYAQGNTSANVGGNLVVGSTVPGRVIRFIAGGVNAANVIETISSTGVSVTGNISATGNIGATYYTGSAKYLTDIPVQINSDWNNVNPASFANIRNRPDLSVYATVSQLTTNVTTINSSINTLIANAAYQESEIAGINSNIGAYETWANTAIQTINANVGAFELYANANIGTIYTNLNTLTANVSAFELYANANIGTDRVWLSNLQSNINSITANVGAYESFANVWFGNLQSNITTINNSITNISGNASLTFVLNSAYSLGTTTATQSIFGLTNGVQLTSNTRYLYEINTVFELTENGPGDPNLSYSLAVSGGAVLAKHAYNVQMNNDSTRTDNSAGITMMSNDITTGFATPVVVATIKNTYNAALVRGTVDITTGGNVNFMVTLSKAVTSLSIPQLSYIKLTAVGPIGANTVIGTWS